MASYTEHLKLLKKDPVADGADTFNIQTMLNDNWDKIDESVAKKAELEKLDAHTSDKDNPHGVTAQQVGARPDTWVPSWGDVTGKPSAFPPSAHTHNAEQVTAGTLAGKVLASAASAADVTAAQLRNIYAGTGDMTAGSSSLATGCVYLVYE